VNVAVLTLTRDRLAYTQHCFATLQELAGCDYDHYIVDQASTDGTDAWLDQEYEADRITAYAVLTENVGICRALNLMLDEEFNPVDFDVVVRWDNDCELIQPDTLKAVCEVALDYDLIVAPRVVGLRNPPPILGRFVYDSRYSLDVVHHLGGIFMAIPAKAFSEYGFRYDERQPLWAGDELICPWWASVADRTTGGGRSGYLDGFEVNHYLSTDGQAADNPEYFRRRVLEGGPAR
jgi:GT2 family glycosyltransferase